MNSQDIFDFFIVEQLSTEFCGLIDHQGGLGVEAIFTKKGVYEINGACCEGREAISQAYEARRALGLRTARHLITNYRVRRVDVGTLTATGLMLIYAKDGVPPLPMDPMMLADIEDTFRVEDGEWLFERRKLTTVFRDASQKPNLTLATNAVN